MKFYLLRLFIAFTIVAVWAGLSALAHDAWFYHDRAPLLLRMGMSALTTAGITFVVACVVAAIVELSKSIEHYIRSLTNRD